MFILVACRLRVPNVFHGLGVRMGSQVKLASFANSRVEKAQTVHTLDMDLSSR